MYKTQISNHSYCFESLRDLLAKASPLRSGDVLAGVCASSYEERIAAQLALSANKKEEAIKLFVQIKEKYETSREGLNIDAYIAMTE